MKQKMEITKAMLFMLAGKSTFTLKNVKSGNHLTYSVSKKENKNIWFVKSKFGYDFKYIGYINSRGLFSITRKSWNTDSINTAVFLSFFRYIKCNRTPNGLELWHEGRCGRCGRKLTDPASIEAGFGPECIKLVQEK